MFVICYNKYKIKQKAVTTMVYDKEISDPIMIQYIILYALSEADRIITHDQLTSLVLDNCNIKFTDFRIAVDNLEKIGDINIFFSPDGRTAYCELLPAGKEANSFFEKKIPIYIREPIRDYIAPFFHEEAIKRSVMAELLPLNEREYMADFGIFDGKTTLMRLTVYAGTKESANSMIKIFKKNPQKAYETVIDLLSEEETNGDGERES